MNENKTEVDLYIVAIEIKSWFRNVKESIADCCVHRNKAAKTA